MIKASIILAAVLLAFNAYSQQVTNLENNIPYKVDGLEYGYYISNESSKEVKGEDYARFEITLYVTNNSGCIKLIPFKNGFFKNNNGGVDEIQVAEFNCTNATGKRLTAKKGIVSAKAWYSSVKIPDELAKDKFKMVNAQIGYALLNGQTITNHIIVIVPQGENPVFNCRVFDFPDIRY